MTGFANLGRSLYRRTRHGIGDLLFERRYRVDTNGRVDLDELGVADADRVYYIAANWTTLRRTLPLVGVEDSDVFLDLGSGKGRMVLEAARFPFRRVVGIELARDLHEVALANVEHTRQRRRCAEVELVCGDVLDHPIPDDVTVVFMNNPFRGQVFATVLERLVASVDRCPRRLVLIYYNPVEEAAVLATGRFRLLPDASVEARRGSGGPFGSTRVYVLQAAS